MGRVAKVSCSTFTIFLGIFLIVAAVIVNYVVFPRVLKHYVKKDLVLDVKKNGAANDFLHDFFHDKYEKRMEYYIFNYTNAIDIVDRGFLPDAIEVGPYSYTETQVYEYDLDAFANSNKSYVEFVKKQSYVFDPKTSCETCDPENDYVYIPDPGFFGFLDQFIPVLIATQMVPPEFLTYLTLPIYGFKAGPFVRVKVADLLFNKYTPPIKTMLLKIGEIIPSLVNTTAMVANLIPDIQLNQNNNTLDTSFVYRIATGLDDAADLGQVHQMRPYLESNWWSELPTQWWGNDAPPTCNFTNVARDIRGTLGDFFKAYIDKDELLSIFVSDICRSLDFVYEGDSKYSNLDGWDYIVKADAFNTSIEENCGFCTETKRAIYGKQQNDYCLPTGLLDLTGCLGSTILASNPHFFGADPVVLNWFPRMKPDATKHQSRLSIEPHTGTLLKGNKRIQLNILAGSYPGCFENIQSGIYPLVWVDNYYLSDSNTVDTIKDSIFKPKKIVFWACLGVTIFGIVLALIGALALYKSCATPIKRNSPEHRSSWEHDATPKHLRTSTSEDSGVVLTRRTRRDSTS